MRNTLATIVLTVAALATSTSPARTEEAFYVYAQSAPGSLSVNGTLLDDMPGDLVVDTAGDEVDNEQHAWIALSVEGDRRYSLRRDGVVRADSAKLYQLPVKEDWGWVAMAVADGVVYGLRSDGLVTANTSTVVDLPTNGFYFRRIAVHDGHVFALRSDGSVFLDASTTAVYRFVAGRGPASGLNDGLAADTIWVALAVAPDAPYVYAMRSDGAIMRGSTVGIGCGVSGLPGETVAALPFVYDPDADGDGDLDHYPLLDDAYADLEFLADGTWVALAGDGRIYGTANPVAPIVDLAGAALELEDAYSDVAVSGNSFWAVRSDGYAYRGDAEAPRITLPGDSYGRIVVSTLPPDIGDTDEHPPKCLVYATKTVVGTPIEIPVMATDVETRSADLVVTPTKLPSDSSGSAATWDAASRVVRWDAPNVAGSYKFKCKVADAVNTVEFVFTIEVKSVDTTAENKGPLLPSLTGGKPIVGQPFSFTVVTDDRDGERVTVSADLASYPFNAGATFDPATRRFDWTPTADDQGERTVEFELTDGIATKTLTVVLNVKNGLIF
jgi:hypothetical protein